MVKSELISTKIKALYCTTTVIGRCSTGEAPIFMKLLI